MVHERSCRVNMDESTYSTFLSRRIAQRIDSVFNFVKWSPNDSRHPYLRVLDPRLRLKSTSKVSSSRSGPRNGRV